MMRKQEETQLTGATYIIAGSLVCSWISLWSEYFAASAFLSLTLFILGDAAAALCGKAFGKIKVGRRHSRVQLDVLLYVLFSHPWFSPTAIFSYQMER